MVAVQGCGEVKADMLPASCLSPLAILVEAIVSGVQVLVPGVMTVEMMVLPLVAIIATAQWGKRHAKHYAEAEFCKTSKSERVREKSDWTLERRKTRAIRLPTLARFLVHVRKTLGHIAQGLQIRPSRSEPCLRLDKFWPGSDNRQMLCVNAYLRIFCSWSTHLKYCSQILFSNT